MLDITLHLAVLTLLLQGFLFPLLLIVSLYWMWRALQEKTRPEKEKKEGNREDEGKRLPSLQPLKCSNCGRGVPLRDGEATCAGCGTRALVPQHYADTGRLRREAQARLKRAERYLRRARFFSSDVIRWNLYLAALWLFITPFFLIIVGSEFRSYDPFIESLGTWFHLSFGSLILWIIILCFTAGMMSKVGQELPVIETNPKVGEAETADCAMCGGTIAYGKGEVATLCGYCGVETYRAKVAFQARQQAKSAKRAADVSLVEAMQASKEKMDDLISTPAILIFIFVVCPFFMIYVPFLAWTLITENLLISIPAIITLGVAGYLLKRFFWK